MKQTLIGGAILATILGAMLGCTPPTTTQPNGDLTISTGGGYESTIRVVKLQDGTKCAVLVIGESHGGGISCYWGEPK